MPIWIVTLLRLTWPYLLAAIAVFGVAAYLRHQGAQAARDEAFRKEVAAYKAEAEKANQIAVGLEATLADLRNTNNQLNERLRNENDPVYTRCVTPDSGLRLYNAARQGTPAR